MRLAQLHSARTRRRGKSAGTCRAPIVIHGEGGGLEWSVVVTVLTEGGGVAATISCTEQHLVEELATTPLLVVDSWEAEPGAQGCVSHGVHTKVAGRVVASTASSVPWHSGRGGEGQRLGWGGEDKPLKVETGDCKALTVCSCVLSVFISLCCSCLRQAWFHTRPHCMDRTEVLLKMWVSHLHV